MIKSKDEQICVINTCLILDGRYSSFVQRSYICQGFLVAMWFMHVISKIYEICTIQVHIERLNMQQKLERLEEGDREKALFIIVCLCIRSIANTMSHGFNFPCTFSGYCFHANTMNLDEVLGQLLLKFIV